MKKAPPLICSSCGRTIPEYLNCRASFRIDDTYDSTTLQTGEQCSGYVIDGTAICSTHTRAAKRKQAAP
jgi:hypothetical protein